MTDESESPTVDWVKKQSPTYPYAYDKGGKLKTWFKVNGIPSAFLIDPAGKIVWAGHPGNLSGSIVEEHLEGALTTPIYEWGTYAKTVRKELLEGKLKKAVDAAEKISAEYPAVITTVRALIAGRIASFQREKEAGDYLAMTAKGEALLKGLKGLPEYEDVDAAMKALKADKESQAILKAQKKVASTIEGKIKRKDKPKVIDKLKKIAEDYPGTAAARDAEAAIEQLRG